MSPSQLLLVTGQCGHAQSLLEASQRKQKKVATACRVPSISCKQPVYSRCSRSSCLVLGFADAAAIPCTIGAHTLPGLSTFKPLLSHAEQPGCHCIILSLSSIRYDVRMTTYKFNSLASVGLAHRSSKVHKHLHLGSTILTVWDSIAYTKRAAQLELELELELETR